jgi:dTDP-4-amino-4,6-dideoxygalactose transaminase
MTIFVTKPYLPPLDEFIPYLESIWKSKSLTNGGKFHQQLELELANYFGVEYVSLFANGTIALITALQSLKITGEVITTPYSFVATSNSLLWNGLKPIFVDIDPFTLNIDPKKIESVITPQTTAILPVHCYGHPCDVDAIQVIADKYNLKIIYDAAHAFGVKNGGGSILKHGDLSVLSLHSTKVFNTFEGGAIICNSLSTKTHIDQLKNFGFTGEITVAAAGINGKMSEFNAALGLLQLKHFDKVIEKRKQIDLTYRQGLDRIKGVKCLDNSNIAFSNYAYFPILINDDYCLSRDELFEKLKEIGINTRRYFYPLISEFPLYKDFSSSSRTNLPIAFQIANQVLCLPIYPDLSLDNVNEICKFIYTQGIQTDKFDIL